MITPHQTEHRKCPIYPITTRAPSAPDIHRRIVGHMAEGAIFAPHSVQSLSQQQPLPNP